MATRPISRNLRSTLGRQQCLFKRGYATEYKQPAAAISSQAEIDSARAYCVDLLRYASQPVLLYSCDLTFHSENTMFLHTYYQITFRQMLVMLMLPFVPLI